METYIPVNSINAEFDRQTLRTRLDKAKKENARLSEYNIALKLQLIELREKLNNIKKTAK